MKVELNIPTMIGILNKNFGFKKVTDPLGQEAIEMSGRDAFRYSLIHGSPFLIDEYGVTLKEQLKVFYHRSSLNENYYLYCPGLFGVRRHGETVLLDEGNAPFYMKKKIPSMFTKSKDKTVIFYKYDPKKVLSRVEIERRVYKKIKDKGLDPENYLLTIVRTDNKQKENFLEYVACEYFNREGYLTESQVPFMNNKGIPDFAAYKIKDEYMKILLKHKLIDGGCCIPEISAAKFFISDMGSSNSQNNTQYEMHIGEAKIGTAKDAEEQLDKYAKAELAKNLFSITPNEASKKTISKYGKFRFNSDLEIKYDGISTPQKIDQKKIKSDEEFFLNYIKFYALGNLPLEKIKSKCKIPIPKKEGKSQSEELIDFVVHENFEDLIKFVGKEM